MKILENTNVKTISVNWYKKKKKILFVLSWLRWTSKLFKPCFHMIVRIFRIVPVVSKHVQTIGTIIWKPGFMLHKTRWPFVFAPKNPRSQDPKLSPHSQTTPNFSLVYLWCGRTVVRCTVTWLPNFLGWVDLLTQGALLARVSRARAPQ